MTQGLFAQGVELLIFGMGSVLLFLTLLVFATRLMSLFILRFLPDPEPERSHRPPPKANIVQSAPGVAQTTRRAQAAERDPRLLAAVVAAVHMHRRREGAKP